MHVAPKITILTKAKNNIFQNCIVLCETYDVEFTVGILGVDTSPEVIGEITVMPAIYVDGKYIGTMTHLAKFLEEYDRVHGQ